VTLDVKGYLLLALTAFAVFYIAVLARGVMRARRDPDPRDGGSPTAASIATGVVTDFFDTLGIGSFATSTAIFRHLRMVRDEIIPGTLNVAHTLPTIAQAFIFTRLVPVDSMTLVLMIVAAVLGAWLGAGVVAGWSRRSIQTGMGFALLAAAVLMLGSALELIPAGGEATQLTGIRLALGLVGNFVLGALMTLGIGLYAPCLILVTLLGMNPTTGFPIMMGSCAFLMPIASAQFIRKRAFHPGVVLGILIGGVPAVLVAAYIVKSLPLTAVRYLVVVVVLYAAWSLLRAARTETLVAPVAVVPDGSDAADAPVSERS